MKQLHWKALEAYNCGDLKFLPRIPVRRDECNYQYTPMINEYKPEHFVAATDEYGEDNAARAFHKFVVIYFGGDYERARDFVEGFINYRNNK